IRWATVPRPFQKTPVEQAGSLPLPRETESLPDASRRSVAADGRIQYPYPPCRDEERSMPRRYPRLWFVWPVALTSLCLFALSIATAVVLYRQQWSITEDLSENVGSRRAASNLEVTLEKLIGELKGN